MVSCGVAVPASSPLGGALVKQRWRTPTQRPVAAKHQMTMPGSRHADTHGYIWPNNLGLCVEGVYERLLFSFPYLFIEFMHKGNNQPKEKAIGLFSFCYCFPCYLLNRKRLGGEDLYNVCMHTPPVHVGQCTGGSWQCGEAGQPLVCSSSFAPALGRSLCAQAIIVNDKVTIEVIIVLN